MNINLHIERVVLDGVSVPDHQRPLFQSAVESELTRLIAADGLSVRLLAGGAVPSVPTGALQVARESDPGQLGQQVARTVYEGMGQ